MSIFLSGGTFKKPAGGGYTGPLDLVSGAKVAYSSARALSTSFLGENGIIVRRSSDNAEQTFSYGAEDGEIDAAALSTFIGVSTGYTKQCFDNSGNGYNVSNVVNVGDQLNQPRLTVSGIGGKPSMLFGVEEDQFLLTSAPVPFAGPFTIFAVSSLTDAGSFCGANRAAQSGDGANFSIFQVGAANYVTGCFSADDAFGTNDCGYSSQGTAARFNVNSIFEFSWYGATGLILINGGALTVDTDFSGSPGQINHVFYCGADDSTVNGGSTLKGTMAELLIYDSLLSSGDRTLIRQNIATFYGITLS